MLSEPPLSDIRLESMLESGELEISEQSHSLDPKSSMMDMEAGPQIDGQHDD
jgi:hypothetical protein